TDAELALIFIYGEFLLRRELDETPTLAEYTERFPLHADRLRQLHALQQALESSWGTEQVRLTLGPADAASPPASEAPAVPGYEVLELLGRGGMGVVYRAKQISLNRIVALKMLRVDDADPDQLARFRGEAEAVARLRHPNIVQVYESGAHEGRPYFSLEYVDGGSLAQQLDGSPLPARPAAQLVQTLAAAVHVAHQHGIIHRDLKPANILLAVASGQWLVASQEPAGISSPLTTSHWPL